MANSSRDWASAGQEDDLPWDMTWVLSEPIRLRRD